MNLRTAIESQATYLAAQKATYRDVQQLEAIVEDLELHKDDLLYCAEHDITLHFKIAEISGNRLFQSLIEMIRNMLKDVLEDFIMDDRPPEHFKRHQGGGPGHGQGRHAEAHADRDQPLHGYAEETGRGVGAKAVFLTALRGLSIGGLLT